MKTPNLVGQRFGMLVVLSRCGNYTHRTTGKIHYAKWKVRCDCGNEVFRPTNRLTSGGSISCGCLPRKLSGIAKVLPNGGAARNASLLKYKLGAARRGLIWTLTTEQFDALIRGNCHYCGIKPYQVYTTSRSSKAGASSIVYTGIDRVDNSRGYEPNNVVSCCKVCNWSKNGMTVEDFLAWVSRVARHSGGYIEGRTTSSVVGQA
jgi:hypothetical protein